MGWDGMDGMETSLSHWFWVDRERARERERGRARCRRSRKSHILQCLSNQPSCLCIDWHAIGLYKKLVATSRQATEGGGANVSGQRAECT